MTSQNKLKTAYGAFALCVVACAIPLMSLQIFGMFFSLALIIGLYVLRSKFTQDTFEHNEMSQLIKSFWIWSVLYVFGIIIAGSLISSFGDMTVLNEWTDKVVQGTATPDEAELKRVTAEYMAINMELIVSMTLIGIFPSLAYAFIRCKKGLARIQNPPVTPPEAIIG